MTRAVVIALLAGAALTAAPASGFSERLRTAPVATSLDGTAPAVATRRPVISGNGLAIAFDTRAATLAFDPNGTVNDVFVRSLVDGSTTLITAGFDGAGADGPSGTAAISGDGRTVAYESEATNLVPGDANGRTDVFVRRPAARTELVSAGLGGAPANGRSTQADISADGRYVAFASTASNLVPGDNNGRRDIFVRDLVRQVTTRVAAGNKDSSAPAISPDGTAVAFYSRATNLVRGRDANGVADVFLVRLRTDRITRVSVNNRGIGQNRAVPRPFDQVADVSRGGRFVVFDSDATNLVRGDERGHTDVFLRDTRDLITRRISRGRGEEANSDSVYPRISPDGRFVTFQSFANNLTGLAPDPDGPDVFVHDRREDWTTIMNVPNDGGQRGREQVRQLLQRPSVSDTAAAAVFTTTARLLDFDRDRFETAYVRVLLPADVRVTATGRRYRITTDDPRANRFRCRAGGRVWRCGRTGVVRRPRGATRLHVRAFGPGIRLSPAASVSIKR